jgi:hypothetical protein
MKKFKPIFDRNKDFIERNVGGNFTEDILVELMNVYYANISLGYFIHKIFDDATLKKDLGR